MLLDIKKENGGRWWGRKKSQGDDTKKGEHITGKEVERRAQRGQFIWGPWVASFAAAASVAAGALASAEEDLAASASRA